MSKLLTSAIYFSLKNLRQETGIYLRHLKNSRKAKKILPDKFNNLHLGCGNRHKQGWLNIDLFPPADLALDLREPFPFPDNSFTRIYSEHFLEHLDYPEPTLGFLSECLRVLRESGEIRLVVPDTEWPLFEYANVIHDEYFDIAKRTWHPEWCVSRLEHINYHFRQDGEHRFAYDFETLEKVLKKTGFINIYKTEFDPEIDSEDRKIGSLYVIAEKS